MIIDNGTRPRLVLDGIFEGDCGESRGVLAFTPNRFSRRASLPLGGLLDGVPIVITHLQPAMEGRAFTARYRVAQ